MSAVGTYFKNITTSATTIAKGMMVTWKRLTKPSITLQYPQEKWVMPERTRGRLFNKMEDCIGCKQCARDCPVDCIFIDIEKRGKDEPLVFAADGTQIKLRTYRFDIDMSLCCYCGLCTYPCPTHCLTMSSEYEYAVSDRRDLVYRFSKEKPLGPLGKGVPGKAAGARQ